MKGIRFAILLAVAVTGCGGSREPAVSAVAPPPVPPSQAYVYLDLARDNQARAAFFAFARQKGLTRVFLECQLPLRDAPQELAAFVQEARGQGLAVTLLTGSATWALASGHAQAVAIARAAAAFARDQSARGLAAPDAIQFDVEPYLLGAWNKDLQGTANQFLDLFAELRAELGGQLALTCAMPYWFESIAVTRAGRTRPLCEWLLDAVDGAVIMDYRDTANRIVAGAAEELAYGSVTGKPIVVAVSVDPDAADGAASTFAQEGEAAMLKAIGEAGGQLAGQASFRGFAVFCYEDWRNLRP